MLGLPPSELELRTYRLNRKPLPNVKVASTADDNKTPLNYVSVKRPRKALGITTGTNDYATDPVLQQSLLEACRKAEYPLSKGSGGDTTTRVPVYVLSMDLADTFESQRNVHNGSGYFCRCGVWRLKTETEAGKDKLPWNPDREAEYVDDESYHIGEATRQEWRTATSEGKTRTTPVGPRQIVTCNPYNCPYPSKSGKEKCKLGISIYLKARDWGNDVPFRVECVSWETNARFPASWDLVGQAAQGLLLGCPLDLVLDWSKPKSTPDGTTRPRPFWTLALPWGMTEEQMRRVALDRARVIIADKREAHDLERQLQELSAVSRLPVSERGRLQEHDEVPALPAANVRPLSLSERDSAALLVNEYGMDAMQAEVLVRSNASDLGSMFTRLGPPPETHDEEPPAIEGTMELDDETPGNSTAQDWDDEQGMMDDIADADFDREPQAVAPAPAPEEVPPSVSAAPEYHPAAAPSEPEVYTNATAPDTTDLPPALIGPMFGTPPETCYAIEEAFAVLGEQEDFLKLVAATWKKVTKKESSRVPSPGTCNNDQELLANLTKNLLARAEVWWKNIGHAKHGA